MTRAGIVNAALTTAAFHRTQASEGHSLSPSWSRWGADQHSIFRLREIHLGIDLAGSQIRGDAAAAQMDRIAHLEPDRLPNAGQRPYQLCLP